MFLLSTNDKTIKLWKIYEKNVRKDFPDSFFLEKFFPQKYLTPLFLYFFFFF